MIKVPDSLGEFLRLARANPYAVDACPRNNTMRFSGKPAIIAKI
jgi:hypothetical protein